jgi:predicted enzyme related to lactoylglutathione lyase
MKRVTGIGGIFIQARNPETLRAWYKEHLGIDVQAWGGAQFAWDDGSGKPVTGATIWSVAGAGSDQFRESARPFIVNYRVDDLDGLIDALRAEGCDGVTRADASEYGKFGSVTDPEGNKIELWEPPEGQ